MKVYGFVPAKGTSERVENKNMRFLDGERLYIRALKTLLKCKEIDEVFLDTESEEMYKLADYLPITFMKRDPALANNKTDGHRMFMNEVNKNPDADIIVKTHPDTIAGSGGYYTGLRQKDNIYPITYPINPISLIQYCSKVYVCTTQFGFEALMCNKEVHTFGMPFYAGWGLTVDEQTCIRRNNLRTLEEIFYIAYIMYSYYVNPETQRQCEIEDAIDYLIKLRDEYERNRKK